MKKIQILFISLFNLLYLFFFPCLCAYCKIFLDERVVFCSECAKKVFPVVSKQMDITSHFSVTIFAVTDYKDPLKRLVLAKKWSDQLASYQLGILLWEKTPLSLLDYDFVVPVPLHWRRYAFRGYNQAQEIARVIAEKKKVSVINMLKRTKNTPFQFELSSSMRGMNVKDAFVLHCNDLSRYKNKHILLVDDLMTTGSTIRESVKVLLQLKPSKITVAVACRVI